MDLGELGGFLKSRRDRLSPRELGLHDSSRRRVPGLRRDEVATLAGASVDYYVQLEQGRSTPPMGSTNAHVHPGMLDLLDLLDRLTSTPAQIISDLSVPLVQNRMAVALLGWPKHTKGVQASFVYQWFTDPGARQLYHPDEHQHQSRVFVADVRAVAARHGNDPQVSALTGRLLKESAEFAELWAAKTSPSAERTANDCCTRAWANLNSTASACSARTAPNACCGLPPRPEAPRSRSWSCSTSSATSTSPKVTAEFECGDMSGSRGWVPPRSAEPVRAGRVIHSQFALTRS